MTNKDIEQLINKYLDGETSPAEECQLARELQRTDIPREWQAVRLMLGELTLGEAEYDAIMTRRSNKSVTAPKHIRLWPWFGAVAAGILLLLVLRFSQDPEEQQPIGAETIRTCNPPPAHLPIVEKKKEEVLADVQPVTKPLKKRKKAVKKQNPTIVEPVLAQAEQPTQGQGQDFEPMYAQTEENVTPYQTMQTVHISSDVVMHVIEASDMPAASTVPSVSELRTRGLRLTNNVQQASQTTVKF